MTPLYLRFDSQEQADSILYAQVPTAWNEDGEPTDFATVPNYRNIDVIGIIYDTTDPENPIALEGWHVNVLLLDSEDGDALSEFAVTPEHPRRIWSL